jgi:hypothetical protein
MTPRSPLSPRQLFYVACLAGPVVFALGVAGMFATNQVAALPAIVTTGWGLLVVWVVSADVRAFPAARAMHWFRGLVIAFGLVIGMAATTFVAGGLAVVLLSPSRGQRG